MKYCIGASLLLHVSMAALFVFMTGREFPRIRKSEVVCFLDLGAVCPVPREKSSAPRLPAASQLLKKKLVPLSTRSAAKKPMQKASLASDRDVSPSTAQPFINISQPTLNRKEITSSSSAGKQVALAVSAPDGRGGRHGGSESASPPGKAASDGNGGEAEFGSASGPSFLQRVLPSYPVVARRFNKEGRVVLRLTIDASGSLTAVEVLEDPGHGFAAAAVEAVRKSRFLPARHDGRPVTARAILPVRFSLKDID